MNSFGGYYPIWGHSFMRLYIEFSSLMIRFGLQFSRWLKAMSIVQLFPTCCGM